MTELTITLLTGFALLALTAIGLGQLVRAIFRKNWEVAALIVVIAAGCAAIAPQIVINGTPLTWLQGAIGGLVAAGLVKLREGSVPADKSVED